MTMHSDIFARQLTLSGGKTAALRAEMTTQRSVPAVPSIEMALPYNKDLQKSLRMIDGARARGRMAASQAKEASARARAALERAQAIVARVATFNAGID